MVKLLLDKGADVNKAIVRHRTPTVTAAVVVAATVVCFSLLVDSLLSSHLAGIKNENDYCRVAHFLLTILFNCPLCLHAMLVSLFSFSPGPFRMMAGRLSARLLATVIPK